MKIANQRGMYGVSMTIRKFLPMMEIVKWNLEEDYLVQNDYYSTQTDVYRNVNSQAKKKPDVKKPAQADEVEFSVLDLNSIKYQLVTKP